MGDDVDHHAELVKADAESSSNSSMSSDDEDFNPDKLEAKDAKEEYDSDPSDTGEDTGEEEEGSGSEAEEKKRVKAEKREQKQARKKTSAPRKEKGEGKAKKKTKLPGQPKRPMSAYFLWLNSEGRDKIKEENPGFGVTEVSKKAGEMWAKIDSDTKERFEKKAKADAEASPEADPWLLYGGYGLPYGGYYGYGYHHAPYAYLGGCRNYLGGLVPCAAGR